MSRANNTAEEGHSIPNDPAERITERLREAGLLEDRLIPVNDGTKQSWVDHTNPANRESGLESISGNYGVYAGNGLLILDVDDYDEGVSKPDWVPITLTVKSPHTDGRAGGHYYLSVPADFPQRLKETFGRINPTTSFGSVRASNMYVVGPGSYLTECKHGDDCCSISSPGRYDIATDTSIAGTDPEKIVQHLRDDPGTDPIGGHETDSGEHEQVVQSVDFDPIDAEPDAVGTAESLIRDFMLDDSTGNRAREYLHDLLKGRYVERGFDDRSRAEVCLATLLYGIFRNSDESERAGELTKAYITHFCNENPFTSKGTVRKWIERGADYRDHVVGTAVRNFNQEMWNRWRLKQETTGEWTDDYSHVAYHVVFEIVNELSRGGNYPSKSDIVTLAKERDGHLSESSYESVLKRLQNERGEVKLARTGQTGYVYYPADMPDPDGACYYRLKGEKHELD